MTILLIYDDIVIVFETPCAECRHVRDHERRFNTCDLFGGVPSPRKPLNDRERNACTLLIVWDSGGTQVGRIGIVRSPAAASKPAINAGVKFVRRTVV